MPSAPLSPICRPSSTVSWVVKQLQWPTTGMRPPATSRATRTSSRRSAVFSSIPSPVVPPTKTPSIPASSRSARWRRKEGRSSDPPGVSGVTVAATTPSNVLIGNLPARSEGRPGAHARTRAPSPESPAAPEVPSHPARDTSLPSLGTPHDVGLLLLARAGALPASLGGVLGVEGSPPAPQSPRNGPRRLHHVGSDPGDGLGGHAVRGPRHADGCADGPRVVEDGRAHALDFRVVLAVVDGVPTPPREREFAEEAPGVGDRGPGVLLQPVLSNEALDIVLGQEGDVRLADPRAVKGGAPPDARTHLDHRAGLDPVDVDHLALGQDGQVDHLPRGLCEPLEVRPRHVPERHAVQKGLPELQEPRSQTVAPETVDDHEPLCHKRPHEGDERRLRNAEPPAQIGQPLRSPFREGPQDARRLLDGVDRSGTTPPHDRAPPPPYSSLLTDRPPINRSEGYGNYTNRVR